MKSPSRFAGSLTTMPGVNMVMAQPISDRVDEMVTGVRADIAVKVFGDDLEALIEYGERGGEGRQTIQGTGTSRSTASSASRI